MTLKNSEIQILAKRYASALFAAVGSKASDLDKTSTELQDIWDLSKSNEDFSKLINSPVFSKEDKIETLKKISKKSKLTEKTSNLLLILAENNRLEILPAICEVFKTITMESKGLVKAEVISVKKLKTAEVKKVASAISKATNKKVECENIVDESIIGGLKVKIGSKLFDNSISGKLERLKLDLAG